MSTKGVIEDITLEIGLAYQDPIGNLRIVRLPARVMFQLDVLIEDVVQIEGGPLLAKMDVLVWVAYPEDEERQIARASKSVIDALELKEGDLVKIRLSVFQKEAKQRKEQVLHHNKEVKTLTPDDLVAAEVTEVDKLIAENPEKVCQNGEFLLVPDKDGAILLVGVEADPETKTQGEVPTLVMTPSPPQAILSGDSSKG
jgi:antitoxin component of MazEF toxin-antitoxin module